MKNVQGQSRSFIAIAVALIIGVAVGVVITAYKTPSIVSQTPPAQKNVPTAQQPEKHIQHLEAEVAKNDQDVKAWRELGNAYFDADLAEKAINAYLKALVLTPDNPDVLTDLGTMYRRNKQLDKAVETFEKAAQVDPTHVQSRFNKGVTLYHDMNDKDGAVKAWQEVAKLRPDYTLSTGQTIQQLLERVK
jgi:cytochrome c-type biogenesis protein CcmH/NrfG